MARVYLYGDESGDFNFGKREREGKSKSFYVTTVSFSDTAVLDALAALRRDLMWEGHTNHMFHAYNDPPPLRRRVYDAIAEHDFRIDTTILTKKEAYERVRASNLRFWKTNWFYHLRYVAPKVARSRDELWVIAASLETKMDASHVRSAFEDVVRQVAPCDPCHWAVWPAQSALGLQLADYCAWAVSRKHELGKEDYYDLIRSKVKTEYRLF